TSSLAYDSATRSENWESTSYGVARVPYTSRLAILWTRSRTGWKPTAPMPVARMERPRLGLPPLPTRAPMPTAMPTYTAVMKTASEPYTNVRLMNTSMSYSPSLMIARPIVTGMATPSPRANPEPLRAFLTEPLARLTGYPATMTAREAAATY